MDDGTLALLIPILALSIPIIAIWTKHQRQLAEIRATGDSTRALADNGEAQRRIAALEERVRVLETIVTDRGHGLAAEIEALRTVPGANAAATSPFAPPRSQDSLA